MAKRKANRLYVRRGRYWGDFRDYGDVGGKREPLVPPGATLATTDDDVARGLAAERVRALEAKRRGQGVLGITKSATLAAFAAEHLVAKARAGVVTARWLTKVERHLTRAVAYFGAERDLASVTVADVRNWTTHLLAQPTGRGKSEALPEGRTQSGGSVRHHLVALSNLYRRAGAEGYVPPGYNPAAALMEKPRAARLEARWLEVPDAALLLDAARTLPPLGGTKLDATAVAQLRAAWAAGGCSKRGLAKQYGISDVVVGRILDGQDAREPVDDAAFAYPLIATYLLTGGRDSEVRGLELDDVSFDRATVTFRPNRWRGLKTSTSARVVPLWEQLREILQAWVFGLRLTLPGTLLFPSFVNGREAMLTDARRLLDRVGERAGWKVGEIRSKMFRHTYCSTRLQTLDHGAPVSPFTVARELGHGGLALVNRVYGHLGAVRHRAEVVAYRVEQHAEQLGDRLTRLRACGADPLPAAAEDRG